MMRAVRRIQRLIFGTVFASGDCEVAGHAEQIAAYCLGIVGLVQHPARAMPLPQSLPEQRRAAGGLIAAAETFRAKIRSPP
jgi:hypothetical protein